MDDWISAQVVFPSLISGIRRAKLELPRQDVHPKGPLPSPTQTVLNRGHSLTASLSAVAVRFGIGTDFFINVILTICGCKSRLAFYAQSCI